MKPSRKEKETCWLFRDETLLILEEARKRGNTIAVEDLTPREQRGKVSGFRNLLTYAVIGIGNFIGGALYEHFSPQLPFFLAIIFFVPSIILTLTMVHEPEKREE